MLRQRQKKETSCKPNVIPILDAVFIFIFFLLMSAQFLEIHEIGSDAPAVKTISEDNKNDRPPLNLILKITKNKVTIMTGLDQNIVKVVKRNQENTIQLLQEELLKLKQKHPKEVSVILKPAKSVDFKSIVQIMDGVREYVKPAQIVAGTNQKRHLEAKELFNQVIFETVN